MFSHRDTLGPVDLAFTDRLGGVSVAPYDELDLALDDSRDDPRALAENRRRVLAEFAPDLAARPAAHLAEVRQVHGADVDVVARVDDHRARGALPEADAMVVAGPDVVLLVRAADCVPVLLADPDVGVIGAAHAGRQGTVLGVVPQAIAAMRRLGAVGITAWIGPHVCGRCYEVPAAMRDAVAAEIPATTSTTSWGTPALDLGAGVRAQLDEAGVAVHDVSRCTVESPDLYSHRRDGPRSGRLAGLIRARRP